MFNKIEFFRKEKSITQDKVAEYLWITRQTFSKIEKWIVEPTLWQAVKLSELLWIKLDNLNIKSDNKTDIKEDIDWAKYKQIIRLFIKSWSDDDWKITKTKLAKLCYLLDFTWYYNNLESITGLEYRKIQQWPVPDAYFATIDDLLNEESINLEIKWKAHMIENLWDVNPDKLEKLNTDEISLIKKIAKKWKWKPTQEIVDFTHKQIPWMICSEKEIIPYTLITQEEKGNVY